MSGRRQHAVPTAALWLTAGVPPLAAWLYFHRFEASVWVAGLYTATKLFTVVWPLAATWLWRRPPSPSSPRQRRSLLLGLAIGLIGAIGALLLYRGPLAAVTADAAPLIEEKIRTLGLVDHFLVFALFLSFVHSAIEEVYWRWFLYGHLTERLAARTAAIVAAFAFAAHHFLILAAFTNALWTVLGGLIVAIAGWVWCDLYRRTGSLVGSWVSHVLVDLAVLWVAWDLIHGPGVS